MVQSSKANPSGIEASASKEEAIKNWNNSNISVINKATGPE